MFLLAMTTSAIVGIVVGVVAAIIVIGLIFGLLPIKIWLRTAAVTYTHLNQTTICSVYI